MKIIVYLVKKNRPGIIMFYLLIHNSIYQIKGIGMIIQQIFYELPFNYAQH